MYLSTVTLPVITPVDCPTLAVPAASDFKVRKPAALKLPFTATVPNELPAVIFNALPNTPSAPANTVRLCSVFAEDAKYKLFPLPSSDLAVNPNLHQNTGY